MLYIDRKCVRGWGELTPDYEMILKEGVVGIEKRIHEALEKMNITTPGDYKKIKYLHSLLLVTEGLRQPGKRYSQKAAAMAQTEADPKRKGELLKIAEVCGWVPEHPARTFHEALQSMFFLHTCVYMEHESASYNPGCFHQYMSPFYKADLEAGRITPDEAQELLDCLWVKFSEPCLFQDATTARYSAGYPMFQNLCVGGVDQNGMDAIGAADLINSILAVKELVYERRAITMDELLNALAADFEGYEDVQAMCQGCTKYDNDEESANALARDMFNFIADEIESYQHPYGRYTGGILPVSGNTPFGIEVGALPSGRQAWKPLADGFSPNQGTDTEGMGAVIRSVANIPHSRFNQGTLLNQKLDPAFACGGKSVESLMGFLKSACAMGVFHVQFNVVNEEDLHDGHGLRTVVFLKSCPLRCAWCSMPESQSARPEWFYWQAKCLHCARCIRICPQGALHKKWGGATRAFWKTSCARHGISLTRPCTCASR